LRLNRKKLNKKVNQKKEAAQKQTNELELLNYKIGNIE